MPRTAAEMRYEKKYRKGLKYKQIVFYNHDKKLKEFTDKINFQGLIKDLLTNMNETSTICVQTLDSKTNCFNFYQYSVKGYMKGGDE